MSRANHKRIGRVHVYELSPVDHQPLTLTAEAAKEFADVSYQYEKAVLGVEAFDFDQLAEIDEAIVLSGAVVEGTAQHSGWQGPTRFGAFPIRWESGLFVYGIRKLKNNGTTFVASLAPMPWLEEDPL